MATLTLAANTGWVVGYTIGIFVVLVVVALVVPILLLARRVGEQAAVVNEGLVKAAHNTAGLAGLQTTIESAEAIVDGLNRGRKRLGG